MPQRPYTPNQLYLMAVDPEKWVDDNDPIRYVKAFVESLGSEVWAALGVNPAAERGAARYDPRMVLSAILAGFMAGCRSSREIERACRDRVSFRYLLAGQTPDHNTLWRFRKQHEAHLRVLLRETVLTAVQMELVALALQAVDGTKILASARRNRTLTVEELIVLEARLDAAIAELEAQDAGDAPAPATLPDTLWDMTVLRERVAAARRQVQATGASRVNLTDPQATMMHTPVGKRPAYNAQAVVAALDEEQAGCAGRLILGAEVVCEGTDNHLLAEMIAAAHIDGHPVEMTVADAGYHSGETLAACASAGYPVVLPESMPPAKRAHPFHHDRFIYDPATDTVRCPQGATLKRFATRRDGDRRYRGDPATCGACSVRGECCTSASGNPRTVRLDPHDGHLRQHRTWMATDEAQRIKRRRQGMIEPVFGILKEPMRARQWLVRGLQAVQAEWTLLAVAFNLRTLAKVWATTFGRQSPKTFSSKQTRLRFSNHRHHWSTRRCTSMIKLPLPSCH